MDKDTADLQKITDALADGELDAGQIAVETQLPVSRVIVLLGKRCGDAGPYLRRDVNGVYEYSLRPVAPPGESSGSMTSKEELAAIATKHKLTKLLIDYTAPPTVTRAVHTNDFEAVRAYVVGQRKQIEEEKGRLGAREGVIGQLEDILKAVKT